VLPLLPPNVRSPFGIQIQPLTVELFGMNVKLPAVW